MKAIPEPTLERRIEDGGHPAQGRNQIVGVRGLRGLDHRRGAGRLVDDQHPRRNCSTKWAVFLMSLKSLIETGKGAPDPHDVKIDNWN
jgi:hypothetical protein